MKNAVPPGESFHLPPSARLGTQVQTKWAEWIHAKKLSGAQSIAVFRKEDERLVVYVYKPALCGVLKVGDTAPKLRAFREWKEPLSRIRKKLEERGWVIDPNGAEVRYASH